MTKLLHLDSEVNTTQDSERESIILCQHLLLTVHQTYACTPQPPPTHTHPHRTTPLLPATLLCWEKARIVIPGKQWQDGFAGNDWSPSSCSIMWNRLIDAKMRRWPAGGRYRCALFKIEIEKCCYYLQGSSPLIWIKLYERFFKMHLCHLHMNYGLNEE